MESRNSPRQMVICMLHMLTKLNSMTETLEVGEFRLDSIWRCPLYRLSATALRLPDLSLVQNVLLSEGAGLLPSGNERAGSCFTANLARCV